jgi:hypothetical protein
MNAMAAVVAPVAVEPVAGGPVLTARGIEKAYRRGMWPVRRTRQVLRGVDLTLGPTRWSGWSGRTAPANPR